MELQQVNAYEQVGHHHRHGGLKKGHHLRVRGHGGHCGGGRHGHKHHSKRGHGHHGFRRLCHVGHGHGFLIVEEQAKHGEKIIVASVGDQPQPESSEGDVPHHRRRHRHHGYHLRRHRDGCHLSHHHHCVQVTEAGEGAPNELSAAIVRMHLEDEPNE